MNFKNKKILVVGAAKSGISAAKLLKHLGADVTLADSKSNEEIPEAIEEMERIGVRLHTGQNAGAEIIKKQSLIITSPGVPPDIETFNIARNEKIPIMGEMELGYTLCPCPIAAITGTNGKTTTVSLVGEIISNYIDDTRILGNIGNPFTEHVTTLKEDSFAVIEASSFQLESISSFKPAISAILNITPDHLDRHKTMEKYIEAKTNIYKYTDSDCVVILNQDDEILSRLAVETGAKVLRFSARQEIDEGAYLKKGNIVVKYSGKELEIINVAELKIPGAHNVENALAAAIISFCAGVPGELLAKGLREFKGVPHRIELVRELKGVKYFNDSKGTNPDASIKALKAMKGKTVLIAGGYDKNADFSQLAAMFTENLAHLIVLGETKGKILEACVKAGFYNYSEAKDYEEAVNIAEETAEEGGNVLLSPACASWDMFSNFEERGNYFKTLVNSL